MADLNTLRLSICPDCKNPLSKNTTISVYRCGGCGAVLRGQAKNRVGDNILEKRIVEMSGSSDGDVRVNGGRLFGREKGLEMNGPVANIRGNELDYALRREHRDLRSQFGSQSLDEGPSNYYQGQGYDYRQPSRSHNYQHIDEDRADLLRKLDELKERVMGSSSVNPKERIPFGSQLVTYSDDFDSISSTSSGSGRNQAPLSFNRYQDQLQFPYTSSPNRMINLKNGFGGSNQSFGLYNNNHQQSHQYLSETSHDLPEPYPQNTILHHPSCQCNICYDKHNRSSPYNPAFGPSYHSPRTTFPPSMNLRGSPINSRQPPDVKFKTGSVFHNARGTAAHICLPFAGGAPFLTCHNCFELLRMPKVTMLTVNNKQKLKCGACAVVISFTIENKKLTFTLRGETEPITTEAEGNSSELTNIGNSNSFGCATQNTDTFSSEDYDNLGYDYESLDREPGQGSNSRKSEGTESSLFSSPRASGDEAGVEPITTEGERNSTISSRRTKRILASVDKAGVDYPIKGSLSPPPPGSSLHELFDYSTQNRAILKFGTENQNNASEQENAVIPNKVVPQRNTWTDAALQSEVEVSFEEYSHTEVSQESLEISKDENQLNDSESSELYIENLIKKSFDDLTARNEQRGRSSVSVNGQPVPYHLVKRAEKMAGPIAAGDYWYDYRAGFWGVMGGPCLGIIPPFIDELSYAMTENCAAGNTNVFVNGRELNDKDFELLVIRGLPADKDRSYIVDISGRVKDEDTGAELKNLGKLAPTVERTKHGFGMKVPRRVAR